MGFYFYTYQDKRLQYDRQESYESKLRSTRSKTSNNPMMLASLNGLKFLLNNGPHSFDIGLVSSFKPKAT